LASIRAYLLPFANREYLTGQWVRQATREEEKREEKGSLSIQSITGNGNRPAEIPLCSSIALENGRRARAVE
jgi:hypothetical protein